MGFRAAQQRGTEEPEEGLKTSRKRKTMVGTLQACEDKQQGENGVRVLGFYLCVGYESVQALIDHFEIRIELDL